MSAQTLPPHLKHLHAQLSNSANPQLREELDAVGQLIAHNRTVDPKSGPLSHIDTLAKSFTGTTGAGSGAGICQCCKRPF
jgi:hypothetical protein